MKECPFSIQNNCTETSDPINNLCLTEDCKKCFYFQKKKYNDSSLRIIIDDRCIGMIQESVTKNGNFKFSGFIVDKNNKIKSKFSTEGFTHYDDGTISIQAYSYDTEVTYRFRKPKDEELAYIFRELNRAGLIIE
jgi:hypothetical protein